MTASTSSKDFLPSLQRSASHAFQPLQREVNRLMDEMGSGWSALALRAFPSMDVADTADALEITAELPGLSRDDVKIAVDGDMLTISGEKRTEVESKDRNFRTVERSYGEFSRAVYLPQSVDQNRIDAHMADGVLRITAPKKADAETRTVKIHG